MDDNLSVSSSFRAKRKGADNDDVSKLDSESHASFYHKDIKPG